MKILLIIFLVLFFIFVIVTLYCEYDYINFIKKNANKYTIDEINNIIEKNEKILKKETQYNRIYTDTILDNIELWGQIRKYKLYKKI